MQPVISLTGNPTNKQTLEEEHKRKRSSFEDNSSSKEQKVQDIYQNVMSQKMAPQLDQARGQMMKQHDEMMQQKLQQQMKYQLELHEKDVASSTFPKTESKNILQLEENLNDLSLNNNNVMATVSSTNQHQFIIEGQTFIFNEVQMKFLGKYATGFKQACEISANNFNFADNLDIEDLKNLHLFLLKFNLADALRECEKQISQWLKRDFKKRISQIQDLPLRFLDLSFSGIAIGIEDEDLLCLKQFPLEVLLLSGNTQLADTAILSLLNNLLELKELDLSNCTQLTDLSIDAICEHAKQLRHLNLAGFNVQSAKALEKISEHLSHLESLDLYGCKAINDNTVQAICRNLTQLKSLKLGSSGNLTDLSVFAICVLAPQLCHLSLGTRRDEFSDLACRKISEHLPNLEFLQLHDNRSLTDQTVQEICKNCKKLKHFKLRGCVKLSDQAVKSICENAKQLEFLDLSEIQQLTHEALIMIFKNLKNLRHLEMEKCKGIWKGKGQDECEMLEQNLTQLEYLNLRHCIHLSDQIIQAVCKNFSQLKHLRLGHYQKLTDRGIEMICKTAKQLEILDLSECLKLTEQSLTTIGTDLKELKILDLGACIGNATCSNDNLIEMSKQLIKLRTLSLIGWKIDDLTVHEVTVNLQDLRALFLRECNKITDKSIVSICQNSKALEYLDYSGCERITGTLRSYVQETFQDNPLGMISWESMYVDFDF